METTLFRHKVANKLANVIKNIKKGYLGRERFLFTYFIYHILPYLGYDYPRLIEWKFILRDLPQNKKLKILDVGCTSSLFIYELAHYGEVFGIDNRPYFENLPKTIKFLQCDISKSPFLDNFFDCIILVSVIEHVGLGSYGDPVYGDGDFKTMGELRRILKLDGMLFVTTIIGNKYIITPNGNERIYDQKRLSKLFENSFIIKKEEYYIFRKKWILVNKIEAFQESVQRFGLACLQLRKK